MEKNKLFGILITIVVCLKKVDCLNKDLFERLNVNETDCLDFSNEFKILFTIKKETMVSLLKCANYCSRHENCKTFTYERTISECELFSNENSSESDIKKRENSKIYRKRKNSTTLSSLSSTTTPTHTTNSTTTTTVTVTTTLLSGIVGSPCDSDSDCLGSSISGIRQSTSSTYITTYCLDNFCACKSPYTTIAVTGDYRCTKVQGLDCVDDIECDYSYCHNNEKCN